MHSVRWEAEDQNLASVVPCARTSSRALYAKYEQAHASGGPWRTGTSTNQTGMRSPVARGDFEPAAAVGRASNSSFRAESTLDGRGVESASGFSRQTRSPPLGATGALGGHPVSVRQQRSRLASNCGRGAAQTGPAARRDRQLPYREIYRRIDGILTEDGDEQDKLEHCSTSADA